MKILFLLMLIICVHSLYAQQKTYEVPKEHLAFFIDSMKLQNIIDTIAVYDDSLYRKSPKEKIYIVNQKAGYRLSQLSDASYNNFTTTILSPINIRKIFVMTGSTAATIYGPDAVNGAIIIITNKSVKLPKATLKQRIMS